VCCPVLATGSIKNGRRLSNFTPSSPCKLGRGENAGGEDSARAPEDRKESRKGRISKGASREGGEKKKQLSGRIASPTYA